MDAPGCETLFIHQLGDCHDGTPDGSCMQVRHRRRPDPPRACLTTPVPLAGLVPVSVQYYALALCL